MITRISLPFSDVHYDVAPGKVIALGLNYRSHIDESDTVDVQGFTQEEPEEPILFPKLPTSIIGNEDLIRIPSILHEYGFEEERTDYEGELAVIIGRGGKHIPVSEALQHVLGYTCANDISQRNIQNADRSGWFRGKSFDTFLPLGPILVPADQIEDPQNLEITTRLNGTVVQKSNTRHMIFPVAETIAFISRNMTIEEGDIILTGTPAGIGHLTSGDTVSVEISGIGTLTNSVVYGDT